MITKASLEIRTSSADIYNASKVNEIFFCHRYLHDSHSLFFFPKVNICIKILSVAQGSYLSVQAVSSRLSLSDSYLTAYERKGKG